MALKSLKNELKSLSDPDKAKVLQRFFKTGKGEYGEGDIFLGIKVPVQRKIAKKYYGMSFDDIQKLLHSKIHEYRLTSIFLLIDAYKEAKKNNNEKEVVDFYLNNTKWINNWDLIDLSAPNIIGDYLLNRKEERVLLIKLAKSNDLWKKRIAILSTFAFIRNSEYKDTLKISEILLKDDHDLIHKGVGWMLREVGKRCGIEYEETFLKKHYKKMPRTMLRYSIERFPVDKKKHYMKK